MSLEQLPAVVVDKSFADWHSKKLSVMEDLAKRCRLLIPSAFVYELLTSKTVDRRKRAMLKDSVFQRVHIPELLQRERESGVPAQWQSAARPFSRFNAQLAEDAWECPAYAQSLLQEYRESVLLPKITFFEQVARCGVVGFSSDEHQKIHRSEQAFLDACVKLRDGNRIRGAAKRLGFPHAGSMNETWSSYRLVQALLLHGLIMKRRYPDDNVKPNSERMEHDVLDLDYLVLALHVGTLATCDSSTKHAKMSLRWRFGVLRPDRAFDGVIGAN